MFFALVKRGHQRHIYRGVRKKGKQSGFSVEESMTINQTRWKRPRDSALQNPSALFGGFSKGFQFGGFSFL